MVTLLVCGSIMADKPLIMSAPMVRALLAGRKTQTRRPFSHRWEVLGSRWGKDAPWAGLDFDNAVPGCSSPFGNRDAHLKVPWVHPEDAARGITHEENGAIYRVRPPYEIGDHLWVRENWWSDFAAGGQEHGYLADGEPYAGNASVKRGSSMMMPRRLSRLTLAVTDVRVQRLQDISEEDAEAEGVRRSCMGIKPSGTGWWSAVEGQIAAKPRVAYEQLWNSIHGTGAWDANPWVAALTFAVHHGNIDQAALPGTEVAF